VASNVPGISATNMRCSTPAKIPLKMRCATCFRGWLRAAAPFSFSPRRRPDLNCANWNWSRLTRRCPPPNGSSCSTSWSIRPDSCGGFPTPPGTPSSAGRCGWPGIRRRAAVSWSRPSHRWRASSR